MDMPVRPCPHARLAGLGSAPPVPSCRQMASRTTSGSHSRVVNICGASWSMVGAGARIVSWSMRRQNAARGPTVNYHYSTSASRVPAFLHNDHFHLPTTSKLQWRRQRNTRPPPRHLLPHPILLTGPEMSLGGASPSDYYAGRRLDGTGG
jgi:hypothetical protein